MIPALGLVASLIQLAPALVGVFKGSNTTVEVAEIAASVARKVTGTDNNDDALASLATNPQQLVEYQKALLDHEKFFEQSYVADKESARVRDIEFLKAGTRNYRADILVAVSILVVFTILGVVILAPDINEYAKGSLTTILGVFLNQLTNVFSFEFGSTRKDEAKQTEIFKQYTTTAPSGTKGEAP